MGRSKGTATPKTIGECQRTAIRFLETALKATKIVLAGYSFGGAAIGEAILQHDFKPEIDYLVIRQATFGKASEAAAELAPSYHIHSSLARGLVRGSGCEMDNVKSSEKLAKLKIPEVIIQVGKDYIVEAKASLKTALEKKN